jgi:hypothetical protein
VQIDLALPVTMMAIATVLSLILLPVSLLLYAKLRCEANIPYNLDWKILFTTLMIVFAAIGAGHVRF